MFVISFIPPGRRLWGESQQIRLQALQHHQTDGGLCTSRCDRPALFISVKRRKKNCSFPPLHECILLFSALGAGEFASLCSYWVSVKLQCYCSHLDKQINLEGINTLVQINCSNHSEFTALYRKVSLFWSYQAMNEEKPAGGNRPTNFSIDFLSFLWPGTTSCRGSSLFTFRGAVFICYPSWPAGFLLSSAAVESKGNFMRLLNTAERPENVNDAAIHKKRPQITQISTVQVSL